jgi:zinc/manganese transport system substrate-binding protein
VLCGTAARSFAVAVAAAGAAVLLSACNSSGVAPPAGVPLRVVAAENFWGSIAAQLGGGKVSVQSIIVDPATDPHSYEPNAQDARTIAGARMVLVNGAGYDRWASQLLEASPAAGRVLLDVGRALGLREGENPHRWYYPRDVGEVIALITEDYVRLDPADRAYFESRRRSFEGAGLACYDTLRRQIRERYAGVPVGYSESIFQGLGEDLGLRLLTPYSFVKAIAEGTDVSAGDRSEVDRQARTRQIRVWVFNRQNLTPDVQRVNEIARERGIPVVGVSETLDPPGQSFQGGQCAQLEALRRALGQAAGA